MQSPPPRPLTPQEDAAAIRRINDSGAKILLIGLGAPRQEKFAYEHRDSISAVQLCVGAAFEFHAGMTALAPVWMQQRGLEWLFRVMLEPGRLWKQYLTTNARFVAAFAKEAFAHAWRSEFAAHTAKPPLPPLTATNPASETSSGKPPRPADRSVSKAA